MDIIGWKIWIFDEWYVVDSSEKWVKKQKKDQKLVYVVKNPFLEQQN